MTDFKARERIHQEPHIRTIERQILDTLLRIEELLRKPDEPVVVTADGTTRPGGMTKGILKGRK